MRFAESGWGLANGVVEFWSDGVAGDKGFNRSRPHKRVHVVDLPFVFEGTNRALRKPTWEAIFVHVRAGASKPSAINVALIQRK